MIGARRGQGDLGWLAVELRADTSDRKTSGARDESLEMRARYWWLAPMADNV